MIHANIKFLREGNNLKQNEVERKLGLNKGVVSTYENSTTPKLVIIQSLVELFKEYHPKLTIDDLVNSDLSKTRSNTATQEPVKSDNSEVTSADQKLIDKILNTNKKVSKEKLKVLFEIDIFREYFFKELIAEMIYDSPK